jgi:hypothetical protein
MNCPEKAIQPTLLLGAKSGRDAVSAPTAGQSAAPTQIRPVKAPPTRPDIRFKANLDMVASFSFGLQRGFGCGVGTRHLECAEIPGLRAMQT